MADRASSFSRFGARRQIQPEGAQYSSANVPVRDPSRPARVLPPRAPSRIPGTSASQPAAPSLYGSDGTRNEDYYNTYQAYYTIYADTYTAALDIAEQRRVSSAALEGRLDLETGQIRDTRLTEQEIAMAEAPEGMIPVRRNSDGSWIYRPKTHWDDNGRSAIAPYFWGTDSSERASRLSALHPELAKTALENGMSVSDLADVEVLTESQSKANMAFKAVMDQDDARAQEIIMRQSPEASLVTLAFFQKKIEDAQQAYEQAQSSGESTIVQVGRAAWSVTAGPLFDALIAANDLSQRVVRTLSLTPQAVLSATGGQAPIGDLLQGAWDATAPGYMNPEKLKLVRSEHGDKATDVMIDAYMARTYGDDDALDYLFTKYAGDQEALNIIISGLTDRTPAGKQYGDLYAQIAALDMGNTGNFVAMAAGLNYDNALFDLVRDSTNIFSMIAFDPTLVGAEAGAAYRFSKYGIHRMAGTANLEKAFQTRSVKNWFDWYGSQVKRIDEISDSAKRASEANTLLAQSRNFANSSTLEIALKYKIYEADEFYRFLQGMEAVDNIAMGKAAGIKTLSRGQQVPSSVEDAARLQLSFVESQGARRFRQVYTPHMTAATEVSKNIMRRVRGGDIAGRSLSRSTPVMDNLLGADYVSLAREEQLRRLSVAMQDNTAVSALATELSDFTGRRTATGKIVDRLTKDNPGIRSSLGLDRKGWQRKGVRSEGVPAGIARQVDRWSRLMARMPDSRRPISWHDASDADRIYQMMRAGGVHRGAANEFKLSWIEMNEAQRRLAYVGLMKTYGRAAGIDLVNPVRGMDDLLESITGIRSSELHAANQVERFGALSRVIDDELEVAVRQISEQRGVKFLPEEDVAAIRSDIYARKIAEGEFQIMNPSVFGGDMSSAVWWGQTSQYGFFPNISALDGITARSSMLNALLVNNKLGTGVTDWWVLGTLAGPRFQLRNGIEEIGLYALTGGGFGAYMTGRKISTGIREGVERFDPKVEAARQRLAESKSRLDKGISKGFADKQINNLTDEVTKATKELAEIEAARGGRGKKLGVVKTSSRRAAAKAAEVLEKQGRQGAADALRSWWLPYLSKSEVSAAKRVIQEKGKQGDSEARELIASLQVKAVARQNLVFMKDPDAKGILPALRRGVAPEDLPERQRQILQWVDELASSRNGLSFQDEAAESARHFADGVMPTLNDMNDFSLVGDDLYRSFTFRSSYDSEIISGQVSKRQAEAMVVALNMAVSDGPRGQAVLRKLEDFWYAYNKTPGDPDEKTMNRIISEVVDTIDNTPYGPAYRTRLSVGQIDDPDAIAKTPMMTLVGMFTTPEGRFNKKLYESMKTTDDQGRVVFKVIDDVDGEKVSRVGLEDFVSGEYETSANVLVLNSDTYQVPMNMDFKDRAWSAMGRSFARMVREPIWQANYIDARKTLAPFEKQWKEVFGDKRAQEMIVDAASERAYSLTMAYGDNPAVRTRLAWEVRNIARFYRATEDFSRRMWRTGRNNPLAFWKASLAWNATIDSGWVYEDDFGEQYFVYPGSKAAISVMNTAMNWLGSGIKIPELDMNITGRVQWLTPSADPESWIPAMSGFWASSLYRPMLRALPSFGGISKEIERAAFGSISADQRPVSTPAEDIPILGEVAGSFFSSMPPILRKGFSAANLLFGNQDVDGFSSRLIMRSAAAIAYNGDMPAADATQKEISDYMRRLDLTAFNLSLFSLFAGMSLPSAPQIDGDFVTDFARDLGVLKPRSAFLKFARAEEERGGSMETAIAKWIAVNPDDAIFMLSENQISDWGYVKSTESNINFIRDNEDLWNESPTAFQYFVPNTGEDTLAVSRTLTALGYKGPKEGGQYADELLTQIGYTQWRLERAQYQDFIAQDNLSPELIKAAEDEWSATSRRLKSLVPGLDRRVEGQEFSVTSDYDAEMREVTPVAEALAERGNERAQAFLPVLRTYREAKEFVSTLDPYSADYQSNLQAAREVWYGDVWRFLQSRTDDDQWSRLLFVATKGLSSSWRLPDSDPDAENEGR